MKYLSGGYSKKKTPNGHFPLVYRPSSFTSPVSPVSRNPTPPTWMTFPVTRNPFGIRTGRKNPIARRPDPPPIPSPMSLNPNMLNGGCWDHDLLPHGGWLYIRHDGGLLWLDRYWRRWRLDSLYRRARATWDLIPLRIHTLHIGIVISPLDFPSGSSGRVTCRCGSHNGTACSPNCKTGTYMAIGSTNRCT